MRRFLALTLLILASVVFADDVRGPVVATLTVEPAGQGPESALAVGDIIMIDVAGDARFHDAIEIEFVVPEEAVRIPGALSMKLLTTGSVEERSGIVEINGTVLYREPVIRAGRLIIQVPVREVTEMRSSAAVTVLETTATGSDLPVAVVLEAQMKGIPPDIAGTLIPVKTRSVPRNIGAVRMVYELEDGTEYRPDGFVAPGFSLRIDGVETEIAAEYLLEPGLHQFSMSSDKYIDQTVTAGVEQAQASRLVIPLLPALATVNYNAPRGARVYVDGRLLETENGVFTAQPGEHTIVVLVGDYTVTRRFDVREGREYSLAVTMDVAIEETK